MFYSQGLSTAESLLKSNELKCACVCTCVGFPDGARVKNLTAMQETRIQSLGQEDPLG